MKIVLLIFVTVLIPSASFTQSLISDKETPILNQLENKDKKLAEPLGFNLGIQTRFDGGITAQGLRNRSSIMSLFNTTRIDLYIPAFSRAPKVRWLFNVGFSTPMLDTFCGTSLFATRVGIGTGFSAMILDHRNEKEVGWTGALDVVFGLDFILSGDRSNSPFISQYRLLHWLDLGMNWAYFFHKHFGITMGVWSKFGISGENRGREIGSDGYPTLPLYEYGLFGKSVFSFSFGFSIGIVF